MQTGLGLLTSLRPQLLAADFGSCLQLLKQLPPEIDSEALFQGICSVEVPKAYYNDLVAQERKGKTSPSSKGAPPRPACVCACASVTVWLDVVFVHMQASRLLQCHQRPLGWGSSACSGARGDCILPTQHHFSPLPR